MSEPRALRLHPADSLVVAVDTIEAGQTCAGVRANVRVPRGHKMAIVALAPGETIRKYGQPIGVASVPIAPGDWVHEHNCAMAELARGPVVRPVPETRAPQHAEFMGYLRANGRVGTRNYLGILTSVNCSATVAKYIAREVERSGVLEDFPTVDGIVPLTHSTGCGMGAKGYAFDVLARTQWGYAANPNMGGVLMVGLGCETFQIGRFKRDLGIEDGETFQTLTIQDEGGTRRSIERGVAAVLEMLPFVAKAQRAPASAAHLVLGLQCGGSDGYSGITANPALGVASDILVAHGGAAILSETPEIFGAEHLLAARAASPDVAKKLYDRIAWWIEYVTARGDELNNNPSAGNKAGGLTTILEKSLGAVAKGGSSPLAAVYEYAEPVRERGFVFMDTPGFDPVSATGQVAGGANVLCFTTGRGAVFGAKPTPSIKLATNSDLYRRMSEDMDINCGDVLDGVSLEEKGREIFDLILRVASGERTKSEALGYGEAEFVPWQIGATM